MDREASLWTVAGLCLMTMGVVAATAWVGLVLGRGVGHVPAVWWANAVLLAIVLLSRTSLRWKLIGAGYAGNVVAHLLMRDPMSQVILLSLCDAAETTFALLMVQGRAPAEGERGFDLTERGRLLRFVGFAVLLGPLLASGLAGGILRLLERAAIVTPLRWFPASAVGMAIVTPLLLGLARRETKALFAPQRIVKTMLYLGFLAATTLGIFSRGQFPLLFLLFPPLVFLVVELGVSGGALGACVVAAIGSAYTVAGHGAMAQLEGSTLEGRILILQLFLATAVLSVDVVGMVLGDLRRSVAIEEVQRGKLTDALETLEGVARLDATTRIANRRRLDEVLEDEWQRAVRNDASISIVLMDVDHFKSYNDLYGHLAGDEALRLVAEIAGRSLHRPGDLLARFGGEEFAMVLPGTTEAGAKLLAEQVRAAIRAEAVLHESSQGKVLTVSLGCATAIPLRGVSAVTLVEAADRALYRAKRLGRDRVEMSADVAGLAEGSGAGEVAPA